MLTGVLLGLGAAIMQSLSYVFSRIYVLRNPGAAWKLMILGHVIMGALALVALPLLDVHRLPPMETYIWPLCLVTGSYLLGQMGLFWVLRRTEASRVSPLLGLKVAFVAIASLLFMGISHSTTQWLAVALCIFGAFLLGTSGSRISLAVAIGIAITCMAYVVSDMYIVVLVRRLEGMGQGQAVFMGVAMAYILAGAAAMLGLPTVGKVGRREWLSAAPWAMSWLMAMILLFGCFAIVNVVYGNIIQSTRGLISIFMGAALAAGGLVHLEQRVSRGIFWRRVAAGCLMVLAIVLYKHG